MKLALIVLVLLLLVLTLLPQVRSPKWWIRFTDFPRLQMMEVLAALGLAFASHLDGDSLPDLAVAIVLLGCLGHQAWRLLPYTPLAPRQVRDAARPDPERSIRILVANVRKENRQAGDFRALVGEAKPDLGPRHGDRCLVGCAPGGA